MSNLRYSFRHSWLWQVGLMPVRRAFLWLALGPNTYRYMVNTIAWDPRLKTARMADIVIRKDAVERRVEADWLKTLYRIVVTPKVRAAADLRARAVAEYESGLLKP